MNTEINASDKNTLFKWFLLCNLPIKPSLKHLTFCIYRDLFQMKNIQEKCNFLKKREAF